MVPVLAFYFSQGEKEASQRAEKQKENIVNRGSGTVKSSVG